MESGLGNNIAPVKMSDFDNYIMISKKMTLFLVNTHF